MSVDLFDLYGRELCPAEMAAFERAKARASAMVTRLLEGAKDLTSRDVSEAQQVAKERETIARAAFEARWAERGKGQA